MDRFQAMHVFARVVEANSFTKAANTLGMPRASVTTIVQNLEAFLGVRLLNRTTRRLSLTPDGAAYYERCIRILSDIEETEASFLKATGNPRGKLRIDVPGSTGRLILIPALSEFHNRYPDIELVIGLGDRLVDLVQEGADCAIRVGDLQDSTLVARRIGSFESVTCATPEYLERYGEPRSLEELQHHLAVNYVSTRTGRTVDWDFMVDGAHVEMKMKSIVSVNDADAYVTCGLEGLGMIQPARYMVLPYLQSGQMREVLPQWKPAPMAISAVYPHNRHLSPKVRVFVDWLAELFGRCPLLSGVQGSPNEPCRLLDADAAAESGDAPALVL